VCLVFSFHLRHEKNRNQLIITKFNRDAIQSVIDREKHYLSGVKKNFGDSHPEYQKINSLFSLVLDESLDPFDKTMRSQIFTLAKKHKIEWNLYGTNLENFFRINAHYYTCETKKLSPSDIVIEDYETLEQDSIMLKFSLFHQINPNSNGTIEYFNKDDVQMTLEQLKNYTGPLSELCVIITNPVSKRFEVIQGE